MAQYLSQTRIEGPIWLSPDEISFLRVQIADIEHQMNLIEQQPSSPELERQKDAKLGEISSLRDILSPVRRVPLEILSHIFEIHCPMSSERNSGFPYLRDVVQYTTFLSKVCISWRNTVVATPKLLSRIFISMYDKNGNIKTEDTFNAEADWIEQWIPQSQGAPLNLYLALHNHHSESVATRATKLVKNLIPFRTQIRLLSLNSYLTMILPIFRLPSSSFPLLLRLHIVMDTMPFLEGKSETFCGASHLRSVTVMEDAPVSILGLLALPFEQLTRANVLTIDDDHRYIHPAIYFDALRQCSENLVSLNLYLSYNFAMSTFTGSRLFLPRLKRLGTTCSRGTNKDITLLSVLTSPFLEDLTLYLPRDNYGDLRTEFMVFQEHSAVTLTSLNVVNMTDGDIDNVMGLLAVLPTLTLLGINFLNSVDRLFQGLLCNEASPVLLPKLVGLEIHPVRKTDYPSDLTPTVLSRWWPDVDKPERNGVCRLQKVSLKGINYHKDVFQLRSLSGLEVYWEPVS